MKVIACWLLCLSLVLLRLVTAAELPQGLQLSYRGEVARLSGDGSPGQPEKNFELWLAISAASDAGRELCWLVEESGKGQSVWSDRFGDWKLNANLSPLADTGPALAYDRDGQTTAVKLPAPFLNVPGTIAQEATWERGPWRFVIAGEEQLEGHDTWRVLVSNEFGRKRIVWIDKASGLVVGINERVFMGQGEEYQLRMRLVSSGQLPSDELARHQADRHLLDELRTKVGRTERSEARELTALQRQLLAELLPIVEQAIASTGLARIVQAAKQDLVVQVGRADRITELVAKFQGQPAGKFELHGARSANLTDADVAGQVTVLHFWDYRDEPLREPYGQIGYLDFLHEKRKADGVRVFGVAVDGRFGAADQRAAAMRGVDRLLKFMNLGYPVLYDDGQLLKQFGDPRTQGGKLPLFVVIGPDNKIDHYFVGCYEVDRDAGLKQLDQVLTESLKRRMP